jgi:hypothetical protein
MLSLESTDVSVVVLVHGYTLAALASDRTDTRQTIRSWEHVVWGDPDRQRTGRIPRAVECALKFKADRIIFGTGATCLIEGSAVSRKKWEHIEKPDSVIWESEFAFDYLMNHFRELNQFRDSDEVIRAFGGYERATRFIREISHLDTVSHDTESEINHAVSSCRKDHLTLLISVSNLSHLPRCTWLADRVILERAYSNLYFVPLACETDFSGNREVCIIEPQSGEPAGLPKTIQEVINRFFDLPAERQRAFLESAGRFFEPGPFESPCGEYDESR